MSGKRRRVVVVCVLLAVIAIASVAQTNGPVQYVYDELGRLVAVIDANGNAAVYNYDAVGNILSIARYSPAQVSVISFTPAQGAQGTSVTIYGTGFSATASENAVQFNGVAATIVSATSNQIVATVPAGATTGPVTVTSPQGSATSGSSFVVTTSSGAPTITALTPNIGVAGNAVTISGTNFSTTVANNRVLFNNVASAIATSTTATTVGTAVPPGAGSGRITLATPSGVTVSPSDIYIPFNSHVVADVGYTGRITVGATQNVALAANQIAILLFDATAGQHASVLLNGSTFNSATIYLLGPTGKTLASSSSSIASTLLPAAGTYAIGIETSSGGSAGVQLVADITGTIAIDGPPVTTTTTFTGQDVRLSFTAIAGQRTVLLVTNVTNPSATVRFLGATGETQATLGINNNTAGQLFFMDTQPLVATGTYTLVVQHSGTAVGSETLQLISVPPDFTAQIAPGGSAIRVPAAGDTALGQNASLTFGGAAGQKVSLNVSNSTYSPYSACYLTLLDPAGTTLTFAYCGVGGPSYIDTMTLGAVGKYTIFVDPQGMATGNVTVQLNDDTDVTGTIAIDGAPVTATTTAAGQDARLTFSATAGQRVVLRVTSVTNPYATVYLVKPDGSNQTSIAISNATPGQMFFVDTQTLATTGTYTLWVQHNVANVGSETLQLNSVPPDFTAPITLGGAPVRVPATGDTAMGQNASLTFSATAGQRASVNIANGTYTPTTACLLYLKDPGGNVLTGAYCGSGASSYVDTVTMATTGTYSVFVDPQSAATGYVTVQLNDDTDVTGTIAIDGSSVTTTTALGQDARLTFTATAGQRIVLRVTGVSNPSATVYLVRPDGSTQASVGINNGTSGQVFFMDTQTLATAGTYTLWVLHSYTYSGSETLQLNSVPSDSTGTVTINGDAVPVGTAMGQNVILTFAAAAGQSLSINLSNIAYPAPYYSCYVTLKDPNGYVASGGYCGSGAPTPISYTAGSAGTYTIVIDPQGANTGSLTIGITSP